MAKLSRVRASEVPNSSRGGAGRTESPAMGELRQEMRDLIGHSEEWGRYELEGTEKEATIRQRLMQAAEKEQVRIKTKFDRDGQTFYFQVVGLKDTTTSGDGSPAKSGRKKASGT